MEQIFHCYNLFVLSCYLAALILNCDYNVILYRNIGQKDNSCPEELKSIRQKTADGYGQMRETMRLLISGEGTVCNTPSVELLFLCIVHGEEDIRWDLLKKINQVLWLLKENSSKKDSTEESTKMFEKAAGELQKPNQIGINLCIMTENR